MRTLTLIVAVVVALAAATPARAEVTPPPDMAAAVVAAPSSVRAGALAAATQDWVDRGVRPCPADQLVILANPSYTYADAAALGCRIWLYASALWMQHESVARPTNWSIAAGFCSLLEHELGHSAWSDLTGGYTGLVFPDNPADPMHSPDPDSIMNAISATDSWGCTVWARARARAARTRAGLARRRAARARSQARHGSHRSTPG